MGRAGPSARPVVGRPRLDTTAVPVRMTASPVVGLLDVGGLRP